MLLVFVQQVLCAGANLNQKLSVIRSQYKAINEEKNYKIIETEDAEKILGQSTDNGASLKAYVKNDSIFKIVAWVGLSNKVIQSEFYFQNGKLIFILERVSSYFFDNKKQEVDFTKLHEDYINRYYFYQDKQFHTICKLKSTQRDEKSLIYEAYKYYAMLSPKSSKGIVK